MCNTKLLQVKSIACILECRLNRFVVRVKVDGESTLAHLNNTGRLEGLVAAGNVGYCTKHHAKKTSYRLIAVREKGYEEAAIVDTGLQMRAFEAALNLQLIPFLRGCKIASRNPRLEGSIIDYKLDCNGKQVYLEVKSAVMRGEGNVAMYPDCPSSRGRRHVEALVEHALKGGLSSIVFIAGLPRVNAFRPNKKADPLMAELLKRAFRSRVLVRALSMYFDPGTGYVLLENANLPVVL